MIRDRSTRAVATLALTLALASAALVGPAAVLAAQPLAIFSATPVLTSVSPSVADEQASYIGYNLSFKIDPAESSNVSQLYLRATTPGGWTLLGVENPTRSGCGIQAGNLFCSFGAIDRNSAAITLTVVYQVGTQTGNKTIDFSWSTTGVASDKGKNSHGDSWISSTVVNVENNADFGASYPQVVGDVISDATNLSRSNPQFTKVTSPATDIVVVVGEDSDISACQALFGGCFGQASVINVANGNPNLGTIRVDMGINANKPNAKFVHFFDDNTYEELPTCGVTPVAPCASVTTAGGKTFVTVYLTENGKIMGH